MLSRVTNGGERQKGLFIWQQRETHIAGQVLGVVHDILVWPKFYITFAFSLIGAAYVLYDTVVYR